LLRLRADLLLLFAQAVAEGRQRAMWPDDVAGAAGFCRHSLGWSYGRALWFTCLGTLVGGAWIHAAGQRLLPGGARLAAVVPVVALNLFLSKLFCRYEDAITLLIVV